jgi:hypothetical protein
MAHDSNVRRSNDPYEPRHPAGAQGNDPLAELARLIGQDDPFADIGRKRAQGSAEPHAGEAAPNWLARPDHARGRTEGAAHEQPAAGDDPYGQYDPRYDDPQYADEAYQGAYAADGTQNPGYGYENDGYYDDGQPPQGDDYDPPVPEKRRGGLMTVAAVVALAVIGTAGAFAYRSWTGPTTTGEPPVIKAEQAPTKIVPAQPSDAQGNKQVYDRVGDPGREKIVPREEQPQDVRTATTRSVAPGAGAGSVLPPLASPGPQTGVIAGGEPKKVKTFAIRPDQPNGAPTPQAPARMAPAAPQVATVPTTPVTPRTIPSPAPQIAARPAPESAETGGYVVQVSSQRTEADAQASYRSLQSKYPGVLGSRRATIKRADLGERGVYYRAQVGPFASAEEAGAMCTSLKEAGGQCIVQRN